MQFEYCTSPVVRSPLCCDRSWKGCSTMKLSVFCHLSSNLVLRGHDTLDGKNCQVIVVFFQTFTNHVLTITFFVKWKKKWPNQDDWMNLTEPWCQVNVGRFCDFRSNSKNKVCWWEKIFGHVLTLFSVIFINHFN